MPSERRELGETLNRLQEGDPQLTPDEQAELATALQETLLSQSHRVPQQVVGSAARVLADSTNAGVRKKLANVLHLLCPEDYEAVAPLLLEDAHGRVRAMARHNKVRRWKADRHRGHVAKVMDEVVKLSHELWHSPARQAEAVSATAEPVTLDEFMERYCMDRSPAGKRKRILAAARHKRISLPPRALAANSGQAYYFQVSDLVKAWPSWIARGLPLPPLRKLPT